MWTETNCLVNTEPMTATELRPRSPGITYQELLDADTHPVPDVLRLESPRFLGHEDVLARAVHVTGVAPPRGRAALAARLAVRLP